MNEESTSATRRFGTGGTASPRGLPRRSGSGAFITALIPNGAGAWTRPSSGSMERPTISGVRSITKARCSKSSRRSAEIAELR
jgi:hypothetical protein